jgi:hypothetical protein
LLLRGAFLYWNHSKLGGRMYASPQRKVSA